MAAAMDTAAKDVNQQIGLTTDGSQFLTFQLGEELYGVDILRVQEIKGYTAVTRIPNTPAHIKGVLNLRGTIVPIVELRTKFGMPTIDYTMFTVIVVVVVREKIMGLVVDAVSDVITLTPDQLRPVPEFNAAIASDHLLAIGALEDRMLILLDIEKLMSSADMGLVNPEKQ